MRAAPLAFLIVVVAAFPAGAADYSSAEGKFTAKFPGAPKVTTQTARSPLGDLKVTVATFATADGNVFMVSYTDFPAEAVKPENLDTFFDGVSTGLKGKEGKVVGEEKKIEFGPDKLPGRELVVDKGKQRVRFRAVLRDARLYQVAVIGSADFVSGKDATAFMDSFNVTK
jgi:hypothetical protein